MKSPIAKRKGNQFLTTMVGYTNYGKNYRISRLLLLVHAQLQLILKKNVRMPKFTSSYFNLMTQFFFLDILVSLMRILYQNLTVFILV